MDLSGSELLIVLLVIVVLFGSTRLPKLARSLGEAQREFRRGVIHHDDRDEAKEPVKPALSQTPVDAPAVDATALDVATPVVTVSVTPPAAAPPVVAAPATPPPVVAAPATPPPGASPSNAANGRQD